LAGKGVGGGKQNCARECYMIVNVRATKARQLSQGKRMKIKIKENIPKIDRQT
jgi:hypothetical protein